jgi:DNA-binding MarR family transcriptional regulator
VGSRADSGAARPRRASDFPYRSELLANLSALILLWDSPAFQGEVLAKSGESIDQPSHATLRHLLAWGPMRPTALSEVLATGPSHVSKIVRRLEANGWVRRTTDPSDGRARLVQLTVIGATRLAEIRSHRRTQLRTQLGQWSTGDIREFSRLLGKLNIDL